MNLLTDLIYKNDEKSGIKRISKTKVIPLIVFVAFFLFAMTIYITNPEVSPNIFISIIAAAIIGLTFAVPVFIVGWIISKFLNRDKNYPQSPIQEQKEVNNQINRNYLDFNSKSPCPHDNATRFKNAVSDNNSELAENILYNWDKNDANYLYAKIIYDGMPPSSVGITELKKWLQIADNMNACDENLRTWFKNTALEVIKINQ